MLTTLLCVNLPPFLFINFSEKDLGVPVIWTEGKIPGLFIERDPKSFFYEIFVQDSLSFSAFFDRGIIILRTSECTIQCQLTMLLKASMKEVRYPILIGFRLNIFTVSGGYLNLGQNSFTHLFTCLHNKYLLIAY